MKPLGQYEVWFLTGSQDLYGDEALRQVAANAERVAEALDAASAIPVRIVAQPVVKSPEAIVAACREANASDACVGRHRLDAHVLAGQDVDRRPPGAAEAAAAPAHAVQPRSPVGRDRHGLHEPATSRRTATASSGYIETRLRRRAQDGRRPLAGPRTSPARDRRLGAGGVRRGTRRSTSRSRASATTCARSPSPRATRSRPRSGSASSVNGYGVERPGRRVARRAETRVDALVDDVRRTSYDVAPELRRRRRPARGAARGRADRGRAAAFLDDGGFGAFTDTFEDLDGLRQLPGIAAQRLMADGYGFGAEGDWKTAVAGPPAQGDGDRAAGRHVVHGGLHVPPRPGAARRVLGAHMLEVCPSIAAGTPALRDPPAVDRRPRGSRSASCSTPRPARPRRRRSSTWATGSGSWPTRSTSWRPTEALPRLPVARAVWRPRPDFATAAEAWLMAGGSHHTVLTGALGPSRSWTSPRWPGIELLLDRRDTDRPRRSAGAPLEPGLPPPGRRPLEPMSARRGRACASRSGGRTRPSSRRAS